MTNDQNREPISCEGCEMPESELEYIEDEHSFYCPFCGTRTPADQCDDEDFAEEPREWIIQKCNNAFTNDYEAWPGYDDPMTRSDMMAALDECQDKWPRHEFRGHRIGTVLPMAPKSAR